MCLPHGILGWILWARYDIETHLIHCVGPCYYSIPQMMRVVFFFSVTDVNECEISPCWNNGTCVNLFGGYQCNCSDDFEGDQCETGWIRLHIKAEINSKFKQTCISRNIKTVVFDTSLTLAYMCWFICVTFAMTY